MKVVDVKTAELKKIPGYTTKVSPSRWKGMIDALLYDLQKDGTLKKKAWLTEEDGSEILMIEMEVEVRGVVRRISLQMEPVMIRYQKHKAGGRSAWTYEVKEGVSWKLFHDLLERKIAAIRLGITEVQHEFMQYISKQLPDGSTGTFADFMDLAIKQGRLDNLQLEDQSDSRVINVTPQP